jgi:transcriptional regulator with XRE-family HTH domain
MEMLDAVEAGIATLRSRGTPGEAPPGVGAGTAVDFRATLQAAGVSASELARAMNVSPQELEAWAAGASPAPEWVPAAIQLVAALSPSERRKLLYGRTGYGPSGGRARPDNRHPFSRIEEL